MSSAPTSLSKALEWIQSDRVADRKTGLEEMKRLFKVYHNSSHINKVKDNSFHSLFESLFRTITREKAAYSKSSKARQQGTTESRLNACADALKCVIDGSLQYLRLKTINALVGHFIHTLPGATGAFFEPLADSYPKSLLSLLSYAPHIEALPHHSSRDLIDLLLEEVRHLTIELSQSNGNSRGSTHTGPDSLSSRFSQQKTSKPSPITSRTSVLFQCLKHLMSARNHSMQDRATEALKTALTYLKATPSTSDALDAFTLVGVCVGRLAFESVNHTQKHISEILCAVACRWRQRTPELRDEMLKILVYLEPYWLDSVSRSSQQDSLSHQLNELLDDFCEDYIRSDSRPRRHHLALDDLALGPLVEISKGTQPMQSQTFLVSKSTPEAEHNWTLLYCIAAFVWCSDQIRSDSQRISGSKSPTTPRKRRKLESRLDEALRNLSNASELARIRERWIQVVAVLANTRTMCEGMVEKMLSHLLPLMSSSSFPMSSWSLVAVAGLATQKAAQSARFRQLWPRVWSTTFRLMSSTSQSRAACHALCFMLKSCVITPSEASGYLDMLTAAGGINHPALICDSSLAFWTIFQQILLIDGSGASSSRCYQEMVRWLGNKWTPSNFENRAYALQCSQTLPPCALVWALFPDLTTNSVFPAGIPNLNALGQVWLDLHTNSKLIRYLLLQEAEENYSNSQGKDIDSHSLFVGKTNSLISESRNALIATISSELDKTIETLLIDSSPKLNNMTPESFQLSFSLILVSDCICRHPSMKDLASKRMSEKVLTLRNILVGHLNTVTSQNTLELVLESVLPLLPRSVPSLQRRFRNVLLLSHDLLQQISDAIERCSLASGESIEQEGMDIDDMDVGMRNHDLEGSSERSPVVLSLRRKNDISSSRKTFLTRARCHIAYVSSCYELTFDGNLQEISQSFVDELIHLPPDEFLCSHFVLESIHQSGQDLSAADVERLLIHAAKTVMPNYDYRRSEILFCTVTRLLKMTISLWIEEGYTKVASAGTQMYEWLIQQADAGVCSTTAQIAFGELVFAIIAHKDSRDALGAIPSPRTVALNLLKDGNSSVQYSIAFQLPCLFSKYVVNQHELILNDIASTLSLDCDWTEGLAMRLLVLAVLASEWSTLRRKCVYLIFETAAQVTNTIPYATFCINLLSKRLGFDSQQQVFNLFRSQIIFTWLSNNNDLELVPWAIFGFASIHRLTIESQDEIVAQIFMNGMQNQINDLERIFGVAQIELITRAFGKIVSYSLLKDLDARDAGPSHDAENRIIQVMGRREFVNQLGRSFSATLGHIFVNIENEHQAEDSFKIRKGYDIPLKAWNALQSPEGREDSLPDALQPSFKIKTSLDTLDRICRRIAQEPSKVWSPTCLYTVIRMLLNSIHPALGFIHARRTIRRVRLVIALSGDSIKNGYPLELLLHSMRPYLTDTHCASDAIPIFKYLLDKGVEYLSTVPSFVAGTLTSIYLGMQGLLRSSQDSITQESQYRLMLSNAQKFRGWLDEWIEQYKASRLPSPMVKIFQSLMRTARAITGPGSSSLNNSNESKLLWLLLEDMRSRKNILTQQFSQICLKQLCEGFEIAESYFEDICGVGEQASALSAPVWATTQWSDLDENYKLWVSRVLGLTFRFEGTIPDKLTGETTLASLKMLTKSSAELSPSTVAIVRHFVVNLQNESQNDVAMAEETLRDMLSTSDANEKAEVEHMIPESARVALQPPLQGNRSMRSEIIVEHSSLDEAFVDTLQQSVETWAQRINITLLADTTHDSMLGSVIPSLKSNKSRISMRLFPFILHCALKNADRFGTALGQELSEAIGHCLEEYEPSRTAHFTLLIQSVIYLLTQRFPQEITRMDRCRWLDINYRHLAEIAAACKMFKSALYLLELAEAQESSASRRRSTRKANPPNELLLSIFREIEEPDAFHGVAQHPNLDSVADRLAFEGKGSQEVLIRGAQADSESRLRQSNNQQAFTHTLNSLARLNMNSIAYNLGIGYSSGSVDSATTDSITRAALKLRQWDLNLSGTNKNSTSLMYQTYQSIQEASDLVTVKDQLKRNSVRVFDCLKQHEDSDRSLRSSFASLVALADANEVLSIRSGTELSELSSKWQLGQTWVDAGHLEDLEMILASRDTLFGMMTDNKDLQRMLGLDRRTALLEEAKVNLQSSQLLRSVGCYQQALNNVTYLSDLIQGCKETGINIEVAVKQELSNVLWEQGELIPSINVLKDLVNNQDLHAQAIPIGKADLLATLGRRVSSARMERPEEILNRYLVKAQKALNRQRKGGEAGRAFHEYAAYCHAQLTNSEFLQEYDRTQSFKDKRQKEIEELEALLKSNIPEDQKSRAKSDRNKARKWYDIDRKEFERLSNSREEFLRQSLENYILALGASDEHDTDILRFIALWLEHATNATANDAVSRNFREVPMHKFAPLMSQLASRLQDNDDSFQQTMLRLVEMICIEHPYHGMYHIYAGCNTKGGNDPTANNRNAAAMKVALKLQAKQETAAVWHNLQKANDLYIKLANVRNEALKAGTRIALNKVSASKYVARDVPTLSVPPITVSIPLRADRDYSQTPVVTSFKPDMSIASGLSAPKIITALVSDGTQSKQLFKAGSDDLRQDAIMEQVFQVVSALLQTDRATRQRNLRIRTYNVIPLDAVSGAIEFVQDTLPLNDFLRTAHRQYYPKDISWDLARNKIDDARQRSVETRVRVYKEITDKFHPVLRHFFFERFEDPDDWFHRRLAYIRSTASISILGHALGLGDRHCQNILLDTVTGEVVHIDLGVAFEAGRILQVPEVVPFRLTRDIVDGMGIMGVEGVFRRCCEFTLESLRNNRDAIMTLLNVLRYDPLYSWSMSPLRAKRIQAEQREKEASEQQNGKDTGKGGAALPLNRRPKSKEDFSEPERDGGEADRALAVVEKKLAPGLSVMATVNELIQQATDERNLAVLFCGWAAFA